MLLTAITFFIILSILILIHELGHFVVALLLGVKVEEFGLGLPPRAWGKKIKGTVYSLNWLPIGGFVKLAGEDDGEHPSLKRSHPARQGETLKKYFWARTKKERAAILLAGVTMNFLLAVALTAYLLTQGVMVPSGQVHIERILPNTPAAQAGLKEKDIIKNIKYQIAGNQYAEKTIKTTRDLIEITGRHKGEIVTLAVEREGKELIVSLVPRAQYPQGEGPMGVAISDLELKKYTLGEAPFLALKVNLQRAGDMLLSIVAMLWRLVTLRSVGAEVAGPIGIAQVTGQAVKYGVRAVLEFMAILSLNLAVLNILPVPALDGGRLAFVFLEKLLGKRVKPAFEKSTHQAGMIILLILILLISLNDILRLARGG
ncbi:MAG: RIP metalloprotease RseP [Patescibacteria group bacterium]